MTHVRAWLCWVERSLHPVGFAQAYPIIWNISVRPFLSSRLGSKRWIFLLHGSLLFSNKSLFLIPFSIPYHLQILDIHLRSRGQTFLKVDLGLLDNGLELFPLLSHFDGVSLKHG